MSLARVGHAPPNVTALLLTGGLSQRMGCDKATLLLEGEPLWQRQVRLLEQLQLQGIWISARVRPAWAPPHFEIILDTPPSQGPLSGISAALERLESSHLLALAVDLPNLTPSHLLKLKRLITHVAGVIARNRNGLEPLAAIYPKRAQGPAADALAQGKLGMQAFAQSLIGAGLLKVYDLTEDERRLYFNLNTPSDLGTGGNS